MRHRHRDGRPARRRGERRGAQDLDAAASRGVMQQGFPVSPVRDWIRRGPGHVPVVDCDGPVMYLPYTCAGDAPDHEAAMPACGRCERGARSADLDLAKESRAFHRRRSAAGRARTETRYTGQAAYPADLRDGQRNFRCPYARSVDGSMTGNRFAPCSERHRVRAMVGHLVTAEGGRGRQVCRRVDFAAARRGCRGGDVRE